MHVLTCAINKDGLNTVISLNGELDIATQALLVGVAALCITFGATLTLECSHLTFVDSRGLKAMRELHQSAHRTGAILEIAAAPRAVTRILTLSGLTPFLTTTSGPTAV